jgi:hypothetical protein
MAGRLAWLLAESLATAAAPALGALKLAAAPEEELHQQAKEHSHGHTLAVRRAAMPSGGHRS